MLIFEIKNGAQKCFAYEFRDFLNNLLPIFALGRLFQTLFSKMKLILERNFSTKDGFNFPKIGKFSIWKLTHMSELYKFQFRVGRINTSISFYASGKNQGQSENRSGQSPTNPTSSANPALLFNLISNVELIYQKQNIIWAQNLPSYTKYSSLRAIILFQKGTVCF